MIEIRTLGSLDLIARERPAAEAVLRQPKRFALFVYLAVSAPQGFVRRDTLLALFWPEADQSRGRSALRQTVYQLRQFLGADAIRSRGDEEISIGIDVVRCDATRFEVLLAEEKTAEALELYRGDFLTGFHVPDAAPELDEWLQSEARRLRALATSAAWSLARAEEQRGNAGGAAHWARRATAFDPLNEKQLIEAMELLARVGDRGGALQLYEDYARRAKSELGLAPTALVLSVVQAVRSAPPNIHYHVADPISAGTPDVPSPAVGPHADIRRPSRHLRLMWTLPAFAAIGLLGGALWRRARPPGHEPIVAIGRVTDATLPSSDQRSTVVANLLSTSIARLHGVHVIPLARVLDVQAQLRAAGQPAESMLAAARQLGATYLIEGSMHGARDGKLELDLQMLDVHTSSLARVRRATGKDVFGVVDDGTNSIALVLDVSAPRENIARVTTSSAVAYRLYDQGLQAFYDQDRAAAYRLFRGALGEDSTFAIAAYYAGVSTTNIPERNALLERARRLANRATDRERLLIGADVALVGMSWTASAMADTMAARYPLDPDAQFVFGHALLRRGEFLAAAGQYRRVITMDSLSVHLDARCLACDAYANLTWSYLYADSADAAARVMRDFARVRPTVNSFAGLEMALARAGRSDEARRALQAADSVAPGNVDLAFYSILLSLREGAFATADARLEQMAGAGNPQTRDQAGWYLVLSLRMQGRMREALRVAERHPDPIARAIVLFEMGRPLEAAKAFQALVGVTDSTLTGNSAKHQSWFFTHVATSLAAAGDTTRLQVLADSVERVGQFSAFGRDLRLHSYIRGLLWNARQQPQRAADDFRKSIWSWSEGYTRANFELARTLVALKKPAEALYPLQAALRGDLEASNLFMSRTELHEALAQVFDQLGQRDSAVAHYREVATAWRNCDSSLQPRFVAARARLLEIAPDRPRTSLQ